MFKIYRIVLLAMCLVAMTTAWHRRGGNRHKGRQRARAFQHHPQHEWRDVSPSQLWEASVGPNHHSFEEVAASLNWFESDAHNPFLSAFFSSGPAAQEKSWWQGPNICEKKTEEVKNATEQEDNILVHYTSSSQQCDLSETAYKCRLIEENVDGRRDVTIVYECCHGYSRNKGDFGCPKKMEMKNLVQKSQDLGLTEFLEAVKMLDLTDQLREGNFTVFAPINGAFGLENDLISTEAGLIKPGNTKYLQDSPAAFEVSEPSLERTIAALQAAILGHMVVGARASSSLNDEQVFETGHFEGSTIRINYFTRPAQLMTANCIPVVSRDNMASNGVIHTVEKALKPVTESLLDLVRSRPDLTLLKTVLAVAEYVPKLEEDGKFTLLAPTNGAFQKMSRRLRERLLSGDKKCIESVLLNHMLPNVICSAAFQKHSRTINMLGKFINVARTDDEKLFVNDAQLVNKDIMGLNGVMHIIDDVMIPEEALDFMDVLERKGLNELINLIETAGLTKTMESSKNVTFFAPTNEAIQKLPLGLKSRLISNTDLLKKVLTYHVSPSQTNLVHFHNNQLISTLEGRQVRLHRYNAYPFYQGTRMAQCAPIQGETTKTCNGNLNLMSQVMIPPAGNVVDVLAADKRFSTLVMYLKRADLLNTLTGEGPFTVFAPNNEAFDKLEKRTLDNLLRRPEQLANLLKTHIYQDMLCCAGISRDSWYGGNYIRVMSGAVHRVSLNRRGEPIVSQSHVRIVKCDRTANNGNILEIDQLFPKQELRKRGHHSRRHFGRNHLWRMIQP